MDFKIGPVSHQEEGMGKATESLIANICVSDDQGHCSGKVFNRNI